MNIKPKDIYADQKRGHLALEIEREYLKEIISLKNAGEGNAFISLNENAIITNLALREKLPIIFHTEKPKASGFYKIIGKYEHGTFHVKDWSIGEYPKIKTNVNTDYIINKIMDGVEVAGGRKAEEYATLTLISSPPDPYENIAGGIHINIFSPKGKARTFSKRLEAYSLKTLDWIWAYHDTRPNNYLPLAKRSLNLGWEYSVGINSENVAYALPFDYPIGIISAQNTKSIDYDVLNYVYALKVIPIIVPNDITLKIINEYESNVVEILMHIGASNIMFKDSFLDPDYTSMPLKIIRIAQAYARSDNTLKVNDEHVKKAYNTIINSTRIVVNEIVEEPRKMLPIRDTERRIYSIIRESNGISIDELSKRTGLRRDELLEIIEHMRAKPPISIYRVNKDLWKAI